MPIQLRIVITMQLFTYVKCKEHKPRWSKQGAVRSLFFPQNNVNNQITLYILIPQIKNERFHTTSVITLNVLLHHLDKSK